MDTQKLEPTNFKCSLQRFWYPFAHATVTWSPWVGATRQYIVSCTGHRTICLQMWWCVVYILTFSLKGKLIMMACNNTYIISSSLLYDSFLSNTQTLWHHIVVICDIRGIVSRTTQVQEDQTVVLEVHSCLKFSYQWLVIMPDNIRDKSQGKSELYQNIPLCSADYNLI